MIVVISRNRQIVSPSSIESEAEDLNTVQGHRREPGAISAALYLTSWHAILLPINTYITVLLWLGILSSSWEAMQVMMEEALLHFPFCSTSKGPERGEAVSGYKGGLLPIRGLGAH